MSGNSSQARPAGPGLPKGQVFVPPPAHAIPYERPKVEHVKDDEAYLRKAIADDPEDVVALRKYVVERPKLLQQYKGQNPWVVLDTISDTEANITILPMDEYSPDLHVREVKSKYQHANKGEFHMGYLKTYIRLGDEEKSEDPDGAYVIMSQDKPPHYHAPIIFGIGDRAIEVQGIIDTGCNITAVPRKLMHNLEIYAAANKIQIVKSVTSSTDAMGVTKKRSTTMQVDAWFAGKHYPNLEITTTTNSAVDCLIGMNVLKDGVLQFIPSAATSVFSFPHSRIGALVPLGIFAAFK